MVYIKSMYKETTHQFDIPIGTLYPHITVHTWDRVKVIFATAKGETPVIDITGTITNGICSIELSNATTDVAAGYYVYEIFYQHSDDDNLDEYEEEYVIEAGRVEIKERV